MVADWRNWACACMLAACAGAPTPAETLVRAPTTCEPVTVTLPVTPPGCVPGQSIACAGRAACSGYQVCGPDGRSYGACDCPPERPIVLAPPREPSPVAPVPADGGVPSCAPGGSCVDFVSDAGWTSYAGARPQSGVAYSRGALLGPAKIVCLNAAVPAGCPAGAVLYGFGSPSTQAWAGARTIPRASWIWRADASPAGAALFSVAVLEKTFVVGAHPSGTIRIAADDFAQVFVNGTSVGWIGSVVDLGAALRAQNGPSVFDLTPGLRAGQNSITVVAQNGAWGCASLQCPYSQAPAGVAFGGTLRW